MSASDHPSIETDPDTDPPTREGVLSPTYRGLTIGIVTLIVLVAFEAMAVTTAMPVAVRELDGLAFYAWGFSGFMVAMLFGTVVSGEICDRIGPAKPFLFGVGTFTVGLVVSGVAPTMLMFVFGRVIQGFGAGILIVTLNVIAGRAFPSALRPRLFSMISAGWVLPAIVGPLIAGTLTEHASWRVVFLGLVPFAIVPVLLVGHRLRALPEIAPPAPRPGRKWLALAVAVGIGLLQYAGQEPRWWTLALAVVGVVLLLPNLPKLLPPGTLRFRRGLPSVVGLRGLVASAFMGTNAFLPLMLSSHRGLSTTAAGIVLTVGSLGWTTGAWWQGRPAVRTSRAGLIQIGTCFVATGVAVMASAVLPVVPVWAAGVGAVIAGLGMGLTMASLGVLVLEYSPTVEQGKNSASAQMSDSMGQVVFIGIGGVLFAALHTTVQPTAVFLAIDLVMVGVGLTAAILARRVRLPHEH